MINFSIKNLKKLLFFIIFSFLFSQPIFAKTTITWWAEANRSEERRVGKECRSRW